jgi:hypothetical protein
MRGDVVSNELLIHVFLYPWKGLEVDSERPRMRAHTSNEQSSTAENGAHSLRIFPHQHLFEKKTFVADGISGLFGTGRWAETSIRGIRHPNKGTARYPLIGHFTGCFGMWTLLNSPTETSGFLP